jgi:peptidyl-prolyl cis-trans isomerase C
MKLRNLTLAIGLTAALAGCDQLQNAGQSASTTPLAATQDSSAVVATVNGTPITEAVLDLYEEQMQGHRPGPPIDRQTILEEVISLELASQAGSKEGLDKNTRTELQIDQQRRAVVATAAIQKFLETHPITDEELQKLYDEQVPKGNEYKARHILVDDEEQAKKLIAELDKGADFSELAKKNSTGPSGKSGGELGWFSPKQMVAPFSDAVAKLEKGHYTKEPVKTQFGWHIIILDDVRESTPPSFEQVKPQLQAFVQKQRVQEYINGLRQGAKIDIKEQQPATSEPPAGAESGAGAGAESGAGAGAGTAAGTTAAGAGEGAPE